MRSAPAPRFLVNYQGSYSRREPPQDRPDAGRFRTVFPVQQFLGGHQCTQEAANGFNFLRGRRGHGCALQGSLHSITRHEANFDIVSGTLALPEFVLVDALQRISPNTLRLVRPPPQ